MFIIFVLITCYFVVVCCQSFRLPMRSQTAYFLPASMDVYANYWMDWVVSTIANVFTEISCHRNLATTMDWHRFDATPTATWFICACNDNVICDCTPTDLYYCRYISHNRLTGTIASVLSAFSALTYL
jgi:hypothetical protein